MDLSFLQNIDLTKTGGAAMVAVGLAAAFRDMWLAPLAAKWKAWRASKPATTATVSVAPAAVDADPATIDAADLAAFTRLRARAKRTGCPKLAAAVREVGVNFFNEVEVADDSKMVGVKAN
jgi:hypothetical protein